MYVYLVIKALSHHFQQAEQKGSAKKKAKGGGFKRPK